VLMGLMPLYNHKHAAFLHKRNPRHQHPNTFLKRLRTLANTRPKKVFVSLRSFCATFAGWRRAPISFQPSGVTNSPPR